MNLMNKLFGASYEDLWKAVIRPPRDDYDERDLGPEKLIIKNKNYKRTDFTLLNKRNMNLICSFWEPFDEEREFERLPCVVYLHGNSSSRVEAVGEVAYLLPMNICLFAFDFAGCGKSEGEFISLGWFEKDDVECVIEYLRKSNKVSTIGLWGRSMGAVTAIMYGDRDPSIAGIVLDSPFSSLKKLVEELVKEKVNLPNFVINQALKMVKATVHKKANFLLENIEPIKFAERCFIPALFVAANNDVFVKPHHAKLLYDVYPGDKNFITIEGDHNSHRPRFFKDSATIFFYNTLQVQFIKEISDNYAGYYTKNKEVFDELKNEEENKLNKNITEKDFDNNNKRYKIVNKLGDHNINPEEKRGGAIPRISSEINLNNMDFEEIFDDEAANEAEILKFVLEQSRRDLNDLKNEDKINFKADHKTSKNEEQNRERGRDKEMNRVDYEQMQNLVYDDSDEFGDVEGKKIEREKIKEENLIDFVNTQIKTNNKENVKAIESFNNEKENKDAQIFEKSQQ